VQPEFTGRTKRRAVVDEQIERCVQFALRGSSPNRTHDERRRHKRHPFPYPIRLTPVNALSDAVGESIVVLGKHLTNQGLDFYYQHPVSHRRVIASFDCESPGFAEILMDLTWCRFNRYGWYENGGRFLTAINPPPPDRSLKIVAHVPTVVSMVNDMHA
jgi:hypothetical protein